MERIPKRSAPKPRITYGIVATATIMGKSCPARLRAQFFVKSFAVISISFFVSSRNDKPWASRDCLRARRTFGVDRISPRQADAKHVFCFGLLTIPRPPTSHALHDLVAHGVDEERQIRMKHHALTHGLGSESHSEFEFIHTRRSVQGMRAVKDSPDSRPADDGLCHNKGQGVIDMLAQVITVALLVKKETNFVHLKCDQKCAESPTNQRTPDLEPLVIGRRQVTPPPRGVGHRNSSALAT